MKKFILLVLFGLIGCTTYQPAQDVYYDDAAIIQPATYTAQPTVYTTTQPVTYVTPSTTYVTTEQPQVVYVTEQPSTSVIYVNESVYYEPAPVWTPRPVPPRHFRPEPMPPHKAPRPHGKMAPLPKHHPVQPDKHNVPPHHKL